MACEKCKDLGGLWMETPDGLKRCDCRPPAVKPSFHPPVLNSQEADFFVEMLAAIPFFPGEPGARVSIGDEIRSICAGPKEAEWLVTRMRRLYSRWPGPIELRRVYASKHIPLDGKPAIGCSEVYPDGIPSERSGDNPKQLPAADYRQLAAGDAQIAEAIHEAAAPKAIPPASKRILGTRGQEFNRVLEDLETPPQYRQPLPGPTPQVITAEDMRKAEQEYRAKKAAGELTQAAPPPEAA